jgi:hypothetical protein
LLGLQTQILGVQQMANGQQFGMRPGSLPGVVSPVVVEVVGGDVPTFLPGRIGPAAAETQIRPSTELTENSNVSSAASKLRELKRQSTG